MNGKKFGYCDVIVLSNVIVPHFTTALANKFTNVCKTNII